MDKLKLLGLKNKLIFALKNYLLNMQNDLFLFNEILDLLKQKYKDTDDVNFIESGIRSRLQTNNMTNMSLYSINTHIYNYNNYDLLQDLLLGMGEDFVRPQTEHMR